jgi:thioredoxin-related protein
MKKIFLPFCLFLILPVIVHTAEIPFIMQDWQQARKLAQEQNKVMFVDFYTDWCGWCKVQDTATFRDSAICAYVAQNMIPVKIDAEKGIGIDIAMKYRIGGFPTSAFFTPDGHLIFKSMGYTEDRAKYLAKLADAVGKYQKGEYLKNLSPDLEVGFPQFYKDAYAGNGKRKWADSADVAAYLAKQTDLFSEINFSVIFRFSVDSATNDFFLRNRDRFVSLYGNDDVQEKVGSIVYAHLQKAIAKRDTAILASALGMVDVYFTENVAENKEWYRTLFMQGTGDWKGYAGVVSEQIAAGTSNESSINNAAWTIYEKSNDPAVVRTAIGWMEKVVTSKPIYMYLDTYAALLYKDKQYDKAEEWAVKAISTGKTEKENVKSTEELLEKIRKEK